MGTHISRVKSVDLDAWTDEQLQSVLKWGNGRANKSVASNWLTLPVTDSLQILGGEVGARSCSFGSVSELHE